MSFLAEQLAGMLRSGRAAQALDLVERFPGDMPEPDQLGFRGMALSQLDRHDEALKAANRAYLLEPTPRVRAVVHDVYDVFRRSTLAHDPLPPVARATVDAPGVLVFSKDRPMQLDALLTSLAELSDLKDAGPVRAICRASDSLFARGYALVRQCHPSVELVAEGDFDRDLRDALARLDTVTFLVDDAILYRRLSWRAVHEALAGMPEAAGFSLRLGTNICRSIRPNRQPFRFPDVQVVATAADRSDDVLAFSGWEDRSEVDLNTPLEVSSSVYRRALIDQLLRDIPIPNPNLLELTLECQKRRLAGRPLLLHRHSLSYSLPINIVQEVIDNRAINDKDYTPARLAELYLDGFRISLGAFRFYQPQATHEYFFPDLVRTGRRTR